MMRLACKTCGSSLTQDGQWGALADRDPNPGDEEPTVAMGLFVPVDEQRNPVWIRDKGWGEVLVSPSGAIAVHPAMIRPGALVPSGVNGGCCGSDGLFGPNRSCTCGKVVATEWSDCWTHAEVLFLSDATTVDEQR